MDLAGAPMRWWALLLANAAGCGPPDPLADVPVIGGTPEVRAAVRAELAAFDEATGGGRTRVSRVRIRPLDGPGRLERITDAISLSDALDPHEAAFALRHELCHALDDVDGPLSDERPELYRRLTDGIFAGMPPDQVPTRDARREREAFAAFCALGPWPAQLASRACPDDADPDGARVMAHLWDRVWVAAPWLPVADDGPAWASLDGGTAPQRVRALGAGGGAVHLAWRDGDLERDGVFDLRTGDPAPYPVPQEDAAGGLPPGLPSGPAVRATGVGWPDGPAAATLTVPLYHLGEVERQLVSDGQSWAVLGGGCGEAPPFAADGRVFWLRVDGDRISWGPVP